MNDFLKPMDAPEGWASLKFHPLSEICEFGAGIDLDALAADMQNNGYDPNEPVVLLFVGKAYQVLNGRHRLQAAVKAEVVPTFALFVGNEKQQRVYVRRKMLRQHFNESQRAMLAAKLANLGEGRPAKTTGSIEPVSTEQAAEQMNVSPASVKRAKDVIAKGTDKLKKAVEKGDVKVSAAAAVLDEPTEVQDALAVLSEPVRCKLCRDRGSKLRNCPACAEAQAKADKKAAKSGLKKKGKHKTAAAKPLSWNWFEKAAAEMSRFLLELKPKDRDHRDRVVKKVTELANTAKHFRYTEGDK